MKQLMLKPFVINTLRRASYRWPARNECLKAARVARGFYKCQCCGGVFPKREVSLDHVDPVVPLNHSPDFTDPVDIGNYVLRMLPNKEGIPDASGFQVLCNLCHDNKTLNENIIRKINRNNIKTKKEKKKVAKTKPK